MAVFFLLHFVLWIYLWFESTTSHSDPFCLMDFFGNNLRFKYMD